MEQCMYDFYFSLWGINNEIPNWTNESERMKDASRIKDNPKGNNMIEKTIFFKSSKCKVIMKITTGCLSNVF